ncbi:MAG: Hsp70 family protein [Eubacteriales bacterium]|nr:Hsp70 family protein [Eubacteriales bacterium]
MGKIIGIDLGTTNSVLATVGVKGCRVIQNKEAEQMTRSIVGIYKNDYLVGTPALNRWSLAPKDTINSIKRLMGRGVSDPEVEKVKSSYRYEIMEPSDGTRDSVCVKLGGKEFSPVDISAMILKKLKTDAQAALGEEVTHAVITVPAYFSDKQVAATRDAGRKAGLRVMKIIDEPSAAAIAYNLDSGEKDAKVVLVYDLGGGTFDISVLMMTAGTHAILNKEGDMWLGGDDFDKLIVDYLTDYIETEYRIDPKSDDRFMVTLKQEAKKAKEMLSAARAAQILIPGLLHDSSGNMLDIDLEITREYFEKKASPLVKRTVDLAKLAVQNAHLNLEDIDCVLMAGNATCIPLVQHAMEKLFGSEKILRSIHPKYCVAMGAAIVAASAPQIECPECGWKNDLTAEKCEKCNYMFDLDVRPTKTCPHCSHENDIDAKTCSACGEMIPLPPEPTAPFAYGIQTAGDVFNVFIQKNDKYPTPEEERKFQEFKTIYQNQRSVSIPVYGGNNSEKASANKKQGEASAMLPPNLPEGAVVRIKLWLDADGAFDISAQLENGTDLQPRILRGGKDQKAEEKIREIGSKIAYKGDGIPPKKKVILENKYRKVIDLYNRGDMEDAYAFATELDSEIDKPVLPENGSLLKEARGTSNFAKYIVSEYGWLIGTDAYQLNALIAELDGAIVKTTPGSETAAKDQELIKEKKEELNRALNDVIDDNNLLNVFLSMHAEISSRIMPLNPVEGNSLTEELERIEIEFKNKDSAATAKLNAFSQKLNNKLKEIKREPENRKCTECGAVNSPNATRCASCGANLDVLKSASIQNILSNSFKGDIK